MGPLVNLRDYQLAAVDTTMARLAAGSPSVLLIAPTGSGKTVVAAELFRRLTGLGASLLFLVHRRELIDQTVATFQRFGLPAGVVMAGRREHSALIQVASVQTLAHRTPPAAELLCIDECHHYTLKNTYGRIVDRYPGVPVIGLTATPWRLDGKGLADVFRENVLVATPPALRAQGHLVSVTGRVFQAVSAEGVGTAGGDYKPTELANVALTAEVLGDVVKEWLEYARGTRTILFACGVAHSKRFAAQFVAAGVPAEHLDGTTPAKEREQILARVRSGETAVLCNVGVATEGFDLPELGCVILARPTKSLALYLQMVGRVLRPADGKTVARIHDHCGAVQAHGSPYDDRDWSPETSGSRRSWGPSEAPWVTCPECGALSDEVPCPECGSTRGARAAPVERLDALSVALEEALGRDTVHRGQMVLKRKGDWVQGVLTAVEQAQGMYGPETHWVFGPWWLKAHADLKARPVVIGQRLRITYRGAESQGDRTVKKYKVEVDDAI